jgi:hypothetical protein
VLGGAQPQGGVTIEHTGQGQPGDDRFGAGGLHGERRPGESDVAHPGSTSWRSMPRSSSHPRRSVLPESAHGEPLRVCGFRTVAHHQVGDQVRRRELAETVGRFHQVAVQIDHQR